MKNFILSLLAVLCIGTLANAQEKPIVLTKDNTITLNDAFYSDTVANLTVEAKRLDSITESNDPIYLVLNSPGGSIEAGLELIENLKSLRRPVKTINLFSASMGFQAAQGLGERLITADGTLMSHKARGMFYGEFPGQLDSRYGHYLKRVNRMNEVAVARTKGKHTMKSYLDLIENEYWCDGKDCIEQGFADKLVSATCDDSLKGIKEVLLFREIFMGMVIEAIGKLDVCPTNTNILSYNYYIDGQPLFPDRSVEGNKKREEEEKERKQAEREERAKGSSSYSSGGYFSSIFGVPGWSSPSRTEENGDKKKLSAEVVNEIKLRLDRAVNDRKERKVIKGY